MTHLELPLSSIHGSDIRLSAATWCLIGDPRSVEARFGLQDCKPTDSGGNRCAYVVPSWARDSRGRPRVGALMVLADHILGELPYVHRPPKTWSLTSHSQQCAG